MLPLLELWSYLTSRSNYYLFGKEETTNNITNNGLDGYQISLLLTIVVIIFALVVYGLIRMFSFVMVTTINFVISFCKTYQPPTRIVNIQITNNYYHGSGQQPRQPTIESQPRQQAIESQPSNRLRQSQPSLLQASRSMGVLQPQSKEERRVSYLQNVRADVCVPESTKGLNLYIAQFDAINQACVKHAKQQLPQELFDGIIAPQIPRDCLKTRSGNRGLWYNQ